jgi:transposase InsO family protein
MPSKLSCRELAYWVTDYAGFSVSESTVYRLLGIRNLYCSPYHPQTNGKLERFHETPKAWLSLLVFTSPEALRAVMAEFIELYNYRRCDEGIDNVTPANVYFG